MSSRNEYQREQARKAAADKPLENVKPKVGLRVRLRGEPGQWQIVSKAPEGQDWFCSPVNQDARDAPPKPPPLGSYRQAGYRDMRPHNHKGDF